MSGLGHQGFRRTSIGPLDESVEHVRAFMEDYMEPDGDTHRLRARGHLDRATAGRFLTHFTRVTDDEAGNGSGVRDRLAPFTVGQVNVVRATLDELVADE
jgi:hypothetical protein